MKNKSTFFIIFGLVFFLLGFLSYFHWTFELFSNFRVYFLFYFLIALFVSLYEKNKINTILCTCSILYIFLSIQPFLFSQNQIDKRGLKIISANILSSNHQHKKLINFLESENPDIIFLMEVTPTWIEEFSVIKEKYKYNHDVSRLDNFGIAIFSKYELLDLKVIEQNEIRIPHYFAKINYKGRIFNFFGLHPLPPIGHENFKTRNFQFEYFNDLLQVYNEDVILAGDLNCSSFSNNFKRLTQNTNLKDSRLGFGLQGTWSAKFKLFSFAIDHCLVSKNIQILDRRIGPSNGSDHYPVIVELN